MKKTIYTILTLLAVILAITMIVRFFAKPELPTVEPNRFAPEYEFPDYSIGEGKG